MRQNLSRIALAQLCGAALSYWRLVYLNLEKDVSTDVRSAVKERLDAAVQQYTGNEMTSRKDGIEEISKEELLGMMSIITNEYRELKGCGEAYAAGTVEKLFTNAYKKIGGNNPDETSLLLIDRSEFENGKRGFVITDKRLYKNCDYEEEICVSWQDFDSVESHDGKTILLGSGKEICIDHSPFTSHNNASIFLFQTCLKVMHTYRLANAEKTDTTIKPIETVQHFDETFVKKELAEYLEEAKEYSTPLEILSFWRIIHLNQEEHETPEVRASLEKYIDDAAFSYKGEKPSTSAWPQEEISNEEMMGMLSVIKKQYRKQCDRNVLWPVCITGTDAFSKKISNANNKIGGNNPGEIPLLLVDMSVLSNGKSGFLLTNERLYFNYTLRKKICVAWKSIDAFEYESKHLYMISGGERTEIDGNLDEDIIKAIFFLLRMCLKVMHRYIMITNE